MIKYVAAVLCITVVLGIAAVATVSRFDITLDQSQSVPQA